MRQSQRRYGAKKISQRSRTTQAIALILGTTDEGLARLTIDTLVASYGVSAAWADNALAAERMARMIRK